MSGLNALRMLLVDDNAHARAVLSAMLQGLGVAHLREAADGEEAFAVLKREPVDVAVVDLLMQAGDGAAFTRRVRTAADSPDVYLPIVMMTAHSERSRIEAARDAGVTEVVAKPLTVQALASRLDAVIQRPRAFVRAPAFFGPDRRRRRDPRHSGPWRRAGDEPTRTGLGGLASLEI